MEREVERLGAELASTRQVSFLMIMVIIDHWHDDDLRHHHHHIADHPEDARAGGEDERTTDGLEAEVGGAGLCLFIMQLFHDPE